MALLQIALDFVDLDRAMRIAKEVEKYVDIIEVGTPLIKSEGMNAVRAMKKAFPDKPIVADMKTMDVGALEVEMAAKAGANIVTVMGVSDESTLKEAVEAGRRYGAQIMVDIMNVDEPGEAIEKFEKLGVTYVCAHVGIDQQMKGKKPVEMLGKIAHTKMKIAVAGGIDAGNVGEILKYRPDIVIVGSAITKAEDAEESARKIHLALKKNRSIKTERGRFGEKELEEAFRIVSSPNISDAMHRNGEIRGIIPITTGVKLVGRAVTVRTYPGDWAKPVRAIDTAKKGDVIVIDAGGCEKAVWGELATHSCLNKGVAGAVVYGCVRDVEEIRRMKFPLFAIGISPTAGEPKGMGEINVEIKIGGASIKPGDWIIGDESGVVVVPAEKALEVANRALEVYKNEGRILSEMKKKRRTLSETVHIEKWERIV
ncbi:MAG: 3-hexulose-6-phosphate synthase [Candidatus Micrarchaeia archaeon]